MKLSSGWYRLCIVLSVAWVAAVLVLFLYDYLRQNPFCAFDAPYASGPACYHWLWKWTPKRELPQFIAETDLSSAVSIFVPKFGWLLCAVATGPLVIWVAALSVAWVREGFRTKN